ncbi:MAG: hypothetical protein R2769_16650 [Saprospiraceae bacterium]
MKNRFTRFGQPVLSIIVFLFLLNSLSAQNCNNSNPFFNFSYTGPTEIEVDPVTCLGTLTWPNNTPSISCRLNQPDTCGVNIFTMDVALTGYSQGNQIPAGNTVTVYYRLVGNVLVNGTFMNVQDTFCFEIDLWIKILRFNNLPTFHIVSNLSLCSTTMMPLKLTMIVTILFKK